MTPGISPFEGWNRSSMRLSLVGLLSTPRRFSSHLIVKGRLLTMLFLSTGIDIGSKVRIIKHLLTDQWNVKRWC